MQIGDFLTIDDPCRGFQRLRARFSGHAYEPLRHETYAIGVTESGVQAFRYRGTDCASTTGRTIVLHPDEVHDGRAVRPEGFVYRMLYVDAALIGNALPHRGLPFVPEAVGEDRRLAAVIGEAFDGFPGHFESLAEAGIVAALADALCRRARQQAAAVPVIRLQSHLDRARELLDEASEYAVTAEMLEEASGLDRYALARAFRAWFGTSPHRYLVGRRLNRVKLAIAAGMPLAQAAADSGFADQSHMTRHFKARFGLTPGRYARLLGCPCDTEPSEGAPTGRAR